MATNFTITTDGFDTTLKAFETVERGILDLRQLGTWDWVESKYREVVAKQFESEGSAGKSGRWRELKSPYKERKAAKYGEMPILQATKRMYKSVATKSGESTVDKQPLEMELTSTVPYGKYYGADSERPVHDFTSEQEKKIFSPVEKKLVQLIDNAKLRDVRGF